MIKRLKSLKPWQIVLPIIVALLVAQFILQVDLAKKDSQTIDEAVHIGAGYTYLTKGDYRFNAEHPPLVKEIAAFPLLFLNLDPNQDPTDWNNAGHYYLDPYGYSGNWGHNLLYYSNVAVDTILFYARIGPMLLTTLLGAVIALVAILAFGWWAGLIATVLYVLDPAFTGHGHLATTDIGATLGYIAGIASLWYLIKKPSYKSAAIFGVALGIANLLKFTMLALGPISIMLLGGYIIYNIEAKKDKAKRWWLLFVSFIVATVVIWAGYGFHRTTLPMDTGYDAYGQVIAEPFNGALRQLYDFDNIAKWVPLPTDYLKGAAMVLNHTGGGHPSFLFGESKDSGWWYYFPVIITIKTPIISLFLMIFSLAVVIKQRKKNQFAVFLIASSLIYLTISMLSHANLGIRHILPFYPSLFIVVGYVFTLLSKKLKIVFSVLLAVLAIQFALMYPFYLSYFNQFVGGSYNGYKYATDSNLDWAQDLHRIKTYTDTHNLGVPYVFYNWDGDDAIDMYGIPRRPNANLATDRSGYMIIGASTLQSPEMRWLFSYQLVDKITPGVLVFNLDKLK
ncbi:MAG: hypothetical protein WC773_02310 [Patescibacteria group bacterium]|jgi:hypothetical protein